MSEAYKIDQEQLDEIKVAKKAEPVNYKAHHQKFKLPRLYKVIYFIGTALIILAAITVIHLDNKVTVLSTNINNQEKKISEHKVEIRELKQEESELSQVDRIMKIARNAGLKQNNENIRTVKK